MPDTDAEIATILQRLEKLKRQNRRMKQTGIASILIVTSLLVMGQKAAVNRTVEANEFVLLDSSGTRRAALGAYGKGGKPSLSLFDGKGAEILLLLDQRDPRIIMNNGRGSILALGYGHGLTEAIASAMTGDGPYITMIDRDHFQTVIGSAAFEATHTGETRQTSAASVLLFGKDKILWKAP
jgi:hypothetical protein